VIKNFFKKLLLKKSIKELSKAQDVIEFLQNNVAMYGPRYKETIQFERLVFAIRLYHFKANLFMNLAGPGNA
jgi:hypothetical protein